MLKGNVRVIVREASAQQISGGNKRFENMATGKNGAGMNLSGIPSNILFLTSDITAPMLGDDQVLHNGRPPLDAICAKWPDFKESNGNTNGIADNLTHPHAKLMSLSPGLASQYASWPGADGHCGGYTIDKEGCLIPPNIQILAENMQTREDTKIYYTSKVRMFTFLYIGRTDSGGVALACVPGWVSDYLLVE